LSLLSLFSHTIAKEDFVFFDVETTGFYPLAGDRIIEIAMIRCSKGNVTGTLEVMFNPGIPIPEEASRVNKITDDMLADKPHFDKEIGTQIVEFIGDSILVAHNASFDIGFLSFELARTGIIYRDWKAIDTLKMSQKLFPNQKNKLESLMRRYNIMPEGDLHRALIDTDSLKKVFFELINESDIRNKTLEVLIREFGLAGVNIHKFIPARIREAMVDGTALSGSYKKRNGEIIELNIMPVAPVWSAKKWYLIAKDIKENTILSINAANFNIKD